MVNRAPLITIKLASRIRTLQIKYSKAPSANISRLYPSTSKLVNRAAVKVTAHATHFNIVSIMPLAVANLSVCILFNLQLATCASVHYAYSQRLA